MDDESAIYAALGKAHHLEQLLARVSDAIQHTGDLFKSCNPSSVKEQMVLPWKIMSTVIEIASPLVSLRNYSAFLSVLESSFAQLSATVAEVLEQDLQGDDLRRVTSSVNSFYVQCASVFRAIGGRARLTCDASLCARVLKLAEATIPADSKSACNLYRRRFTDEDMAGDEVGPEPTILSNLRESLISPETVFRSGIAWSKFYTFAKDAIAFISTSKTFGDVDGFPFVVLDKRLTSHGTFTRSVKIRLVAQVAFAVAAAEASGDATTDNQAKQLDHLKKLCEEFARGLGSSELLRAVSDTDSLWVTWKTPGAKEACPAFDSFSRKERGLQPVMGKICGRVAVSGDNLPPPKAFIAAMIDTLELPLESSIVDAPARAALRKLKK